MSKVLISDALSPRAADILTARGVEVDFHPGLSPEELKARIGGYDGLAVRSATKVTAGLIERAPQLKVIGRAGIGVDNIDVAAASARRIRVVNAPTAATVSVAELTVALCLMLVRNLFPQVERTKSGEWKRGENHGELAGRTVGFVGYGRIAREVARRLKPFGVHPVAFDPYVSKVDDGTELLSLEALLPRADFVSLHAAATAENVHLIDATALSRMKAGAFLVNVARGALVDEAALLGSLQSGHLGGAALDVFEEEPPKRRGLLSHPRVIATPHIGASTREAQARAGADVVDEVLRALRGEALRYVVNPPPGVKA